MKKLLIVLLFPFQLYAQSFSNTEITRWELQAKNVTIIRDNWGIPHIYGKTDADAVFGLMYAQCEDDFKRVEMNYIEKLGRMAEVKGESELYNDLLIRLVLDSAGAVADFNKSPAWLKKLMIAFADGINYFLFKNPKVKPVLLFRFKPWYPFLWTDGSIGAINTAGVSANELRDFYTGKNTTLSLIAPQVEEESLTGSNGFSFSPAVTASGNSILYINPHVTFYFRPEVHMVSEEGLNAYGAVTWGQFFVYQGFNEHCGWMHTSSDVDAADLYIEKISRRNNQLFYEYNKTLKPVIKKAIMLRYKNGDAIFSKTITTLHTHHGPVMTKRTDQWLSVKADNRIMNGLVQCWQRTKAKSFADFKKTLDLRGNISNNTVYADAEGNIAYWHGNRVPIRDKKFDWSKPVDGTITATEWKGLHPVNQTVYIINPPNGWIQNCNSTPFTSAGSYSPKKENYPEYMAPDGENFRGINAVRVLSKGAPFDLDKVIAAGYDNYLTGFEKLVPALVNAFEKTVSINDTIYPVLNEPISILKKWDFRTSENSVATTLAIEWGLHLAPEIRKVYVEAGEPDQVARTNQFVATAPAQNLLLPMYDAVKALNNRYGSWQKPWGEINRFQRLTGDIDLKYDDNKPSMPVGFASSTWGMLPSYSSKYFPGTNKRYGDGGNSFICAVEFIRNVSPGNKKIKAKSLLAGGQSGDPNSKHFTDQALMYTKGIFKEVLFYKEDVMKHVERIYHPGE